MSLLSILILASCSIAQTSNVRVKSSKPSADDTWSTKKISKWYKKGEWLDGVNLKPHPSINKQELSRQYHTADYWKKAFAWLKTQDLINLKPGTYRIDSGFVTASVSEVAPKDAELVNWETHYNTNDFQYIIRGKAQMGIIALTDTLTGNTKVTVPYNTRTDTESYSVGKGPYYTAEPGTFFIFSPMEIHRPAFKLEGYDMIKKILIKVRVPR
jgi:YhcH/YjgK/YiaL family protein